MLRQCRPSYPARKWRQRAQFSPAMWWLALHLYEFLARRRDRCAKALLGSFDDPERLAQIGPSDRLQSLWIDHVVRGRAGGDQLGVVREADARDHLERLS